MASSSSHKLAGPACRVTKALLSRSSSSTSTAAVLHEAPPPPSPPAASTYTHEEQYRSISQLKGPHAWPIIGNLPLYLKKESNGRLHEMLSEQHAIHGDMFRIRLCGSDQVHIADPHLMESVLRQEGKFPVRPPFNSWKTYRRVTGTPLGIVSGEGPYWKRVRSALNEKIMRPRPVLAYTGQLNGIAHDLIHKLRRLRDTHGDEGLGKILSNEFYKWSMESVGSVVFNSRMGCLGDDMPQRVQDFITAIDEMMASSIPIIAFDEWHRRLNSKYWRRHKEAWDKIFEISKAYTDEHILSMEKRIEGGEAVEEKGELLSYLLASRKMSRPEVYANVTELMLAGVDTTSNSLCFIVHLLATHPEVQGRLQEEIQDVLQGRPPTANNIHNMTYLKCVLREATRLYPVVTMNCRVATEDMVIGGYKVPKDTIIVMNHHAACRNQEVFEDAEAFRPERWLRSEANHKAHPFASLPFGFGTRSCVGTKIAKLELYLAISNMLQQFELKPIEGMVLKPHLRTVLTPGNQVPVRFAER